ncbi:MAG: hypothetical protein ACYDHZ_09415 [Dehalococcoidia bacterium]
MNQYSDISLDGHFSLTLFQTLSGTVSIFFDSTPNRLNNYAADRIQKGLVLDCGEKELVEEGTGFGVPVLKFGSEAFFPGAARLCCYKDGEPVQLTVEYDLNLVHRMSSHNKLIDTSTFYSAKEFFSWLHRKYPPLRSPLATGADAIKCIAGLQSRFEVIPTVATINTVYFVYPDGLILVTLDLSGLPKNRRAEVIICNEMGANYFDGYEDSNGIILSGKAIGTWDEMQTARGSLTDSCHGIKFTVPRVKGARLFRGRELVPGRLAWSGLNYVLTQVPRVFTYEIKVGTML